MIRTRYIRTPESLQRDKARDRIMRSNCFGGSTRPAGGLRDSVAAGERVLATFATKGKSDTGPWPVAFATKVAATGEMPGCTPKIG
jgi:hypothetical protein